MQIKSIKVSRSPEMVWLTFDNGHYLAFRTDDVYKHHLKVGDSIDETQQKVLYRLSFEYLLLRYALRQIAASAKTSNVLKQKLKVKYLELHRKYQPPPLEFNQIINDILARLEKDNLLDESAYVESLLRRRANKSTGYLKQLLVSRGINPQKYSHLFQPDADINKIKKLLPKTGTDPKAISKLIHRVFAINSIKSAIDDYLNSR